jgi:hypothetical protein
MPEAENIRLMSRFILLVYTIRSTAYSSSMDRIAFSAVVNGSCHGLSGVAQYNQSNFISIPVRSASFTKGLSFSSSDEGMA